MTDQITIKLNKKKFEQLLNELRAYGSNALCSNSAMAAFAIWFLHDHCFRVNPKLKMTHAEYMFTVHGKSREEVMFDVIKRYRDWCEAEGLPCAEDDKKKKTK